MKNYPLCRLAKAANIHITPGLHTSQVSTQLLKELCGGIVLTGLSKPAQIVPMWTTVSDMVKLVALSVQAVNYA